MVSHFGGHVKRLIVFVHGFRGKAIGTWMNFPLIAADEPELSWWHESDMLFIGYDSTKETIAGVAYRIRSEMPRFFPKPFPDAMQRDGFPVRADITSPYDELVLVGHSLGGVILRRAVCDAAQLWVRKESSERSVLLDATMRLFSPASAGFQPSGWLGLLRATGIWDLALELFLRRSPAYSDLQSNSEVLRAIRERTINMLETEPFPALRAHIVWANPDGVVITERYTTDYVDKHDDDCNHISVCKPRARGFSMPWKFVKEGRTR